VQPRLAKSQFPKFLILIALHENYELLCKLCNQGLKNYNSQSAWISLISMKFINFSANWAAKACNLVQLKLAKLQLPKCLNFNSPLIYKITRSHIFKMKYEPCPMPWCSPHDMPKILMPWMTNILKYYICDQRTYSKIMAISMPQCSNWFKNHQLVSSIPLLQCFDKFKHQQVSGKVHSHYAK